MAEDEAGEAEIFLWLSRMPWTEVHMESMSYILVFGDEMGSFRFFLIEYIYIYIVISLG